jgi:hypothetical protein
VKFEIVGKIEDQETFVSGNAIREITTHLCVKAGGENVRG